MRHRLPLRRIRARRLGRLPALQVESALGETRYQAIAETLRAVSWEADPVTDKMTYVSPQIEALTGYRVEEWTAGQWQRSLHPEDRDEVIGKYERHLRERRAHNLEYRLITASGKPVWFRDIITFVNDIDGRGLVRGLMIEIEEEKALEQALRESEARYRQAEQIAGLVHWSCRRDESGDAVQAKLTFSDQAASLFGVPHAELNLSTHAYIERIVHPGDRERQHQEIAANIAARVPQYKLDYRILRPDGTVAYIAEICREEYGPDGTWLGSFGILQDVTAQRNYELALKESTARYQKAERIARLIHWSVAMSPDGCWDKNVVTFSDAALATFGLSQDDRQQSNADYLERLVYPEDRATVRDTLLNGLASGEREVSVTYRIVRPDGCVRWVIEHVQNEYDAAGRRTFAFGIIQDITEQKQREAELGAAYLRAELASRAKTQFLATMSHELRTPLNAIIGFSEVMKSEMMGPIGSPGYKEYAADIHGSGTFLLSIINELLDLSLIDSGEMKLDEALIELDRIVASSVSLLRSKAAAKVVKLTYAARPDLPLLRGDGRRLKQAVINLVSNAIKFTPAGGSVGIAISWSSDGLIAAVTDTGIGIAAADLDRVMKPFVQVENWLARKHEGAGLGLAITKGICELHGGRLVLESELGRGTVARIHLPPDRIVPRPSYPSDVSGEQDGLRVGG
jgi:PAS domain S-box-containing protein